MLVVLFLISTRRTQLVRTCIDGLFGCDLHHCCVLACMHTTTVSVLLRVVQLCCGCPNTAVGATRRPVPAAMTADSHCNNTISAREESPSPQQLCGVGGLGGRPGKGVVGRCNRRTLLSSTTGLVVATVTPRHMLQTPHVLNTCRST